MQKLRRIVLIGLLSFIIGGCSILNIEQEKNKALILLPIQQGPANYVYKHKITIEGRGQQRDFIAISRLNTESLKVAVLLANGQKIMSLQYDGEEFKQNLFSEIEVPAKDIMAIMQFSLWPKQTVVEYYPAAQGWITTFSDHKRTLSGYHKLVLEVDYSAKKLSVRNARHDYRVYIRNLDQTDLQY